MAPLLPTLKLRKHNVRNHSGRRESERKLQVQVRVQYRSWSTLSARGRFGVIIGRSEHISLKRRVQRTGGTLMRCRRWYRNGGSGDVVAKDVDLVDRVGNVGLEGFAFSLRRTDGHTLQISWRSYTRSVNGRNYGRTRGGLGISCGTWTLDVFVGRQIEARSFARFSRTTSLSLLE